MLGGQVTRARARVSRSKGPPKSTELPHNPGPVRAASRSQSVVVARAKLELPRAVLDLRAWRPRGGIRFPPGPSARAHTTARPRLPPGPAQLCVHPLCVTKAPWSLGPALTSLEPLALHSRRLETNHLPRRPSPTTHPSNGRPSRTCPFDPLVRKLPSPHVTPLRPSPASPTSRQIWIWVVAASTRSFGSSAVKPPATPRNTWAPPRLVDDSTRARLEI